MLELKDKRTHYKAEDKIMLFNSLDFLIFFPIVVLVYFFILFCFLFIPITLQTCSYKNGIIVSVLDLIETHIACKSISAQMDNMIHEEARNSLHNS